MSNIFYLVAETIADARSCAKEPSIRRWRSPLSIVSIARSLVGLKTVQDTPSQIGLRLALHKLFARKPEGIEELEPNDKLQTALGSQEWEAESKDF